MDFLNIFFILGSFSLGLLVFEDIKTQRVDQRVSFFMVGVLAFLFITTNLIPYLIALTLVFLLILPIIKEKLHLAERKVFGGGDLTILSWIMLGVGSFNLIYLAGFILLWCFANIIYLKSTIKQKVPGTIPILTAFLLTWALILINFFGF